MSLSAALMTAVAPDGLMKQTWSPHRSAVLMTKWSAGIAVRPLRYRNRTKAARRVRA